MLVEAKHLEIVVCSVSKGVLRQCFQCQLQSSFCLLQSVQMSVDKNRVKK